MYFHGWSIGHLTDHSGDQDMTSVRQFPASHITVDLNRNLVWKKQQQTNGQDVSLLDEITSYNDRKGVV